MTIKLQDMLLKYKGQIPQEIVDKLKSYEDEVAYLRKAFDYNPCTISVIDKDEIYIDMNNQMKSMIQDSKVNIIGTKVGEYTKDKTIPDLVNELKSSNDQSKHKIIESIIDEKKRIFWITANKVGDNILTTGLDISELRQLEEDKKLSDKLASLGEMSAFIVHEINNPLATIMLSNEYVKVLNSNNNPVIDQMCDNITSTAKVINKIIDSLKTLIRKDDGQVSEISLKDVFDKSKILLLGKIKQNKVKIEDFNLENVHINFSEIELMQIMMNLISNAMDAIQNNPIKWIKVIYEKDSIMIVDSGNGVSQEGQLKLFEKYYTSKGKCGNGIGLYLSREIANKHKYDLTYCLYNGNTCFKLEKFQKQVIDIIDIL